MGKNSSRISERFKHLRLHGGKSYCLICGELEKLTEDHVPPKVATPFRRIEQYHVMEKLGVDPAEKLVAPISKNGSRFKTICKNCNQVLGRYDVALGDLCESARAKISDYFVSCSSIGTLLHINCDVVSVMRSVVGHMIAASSTEECMKPANEGPFWKPLRDFSLSGADISETHQLFCWFYPYEQSVTAKNISFFNDGNVAFLTTLSFYPIAFLAVGKDQGIAPFHAKRISPSADGIMLDMTSVGFRWARFPFHGLEGNQIMALNEAYCVASNPIP